MFCHLKYISFYLKVKDRVSLSLFHATDIKYFDHVMSSLTVKVKTLRIFKSSCLGLTILKAPHLSAISIWLETVDLPHHTSKCQYFFVWYVKTIRHVYDL